MVLAVAGLRQHSAWIALTMQESGDQWWSSWCGRQRNPLAFVFWTIKGQSFSGIQNINRMWTSVLCHFINISESVFQICSWQTEFKKQMVAVPAPAPLAELKVIRVLNRAIVPMGRLHVAMSLLCQVRELTMAALGGSEGGKKPFFWIHWKGGRNLFLNSLKKQKHRSSQKKKKRHEGGVIFCVWAQFGGCRVCQSLIRHKTQAGKILSFLHVFCWLLQCFCFLFFTEFRKRFLLWPP